MDEIKQERPHAADRLKALGWGKWDLVTHPEYALDLDTAALVAVIGMIEGWFTGKKLRDYLPRDAGLEHYSHARKIINGTDKAELIAGYAVEFDVALYLFVLPVESMPRF